MLYGGEQAVSPFSHTVPPDLPLVSCRQEELKEVRARLRESQDELETKYNYQNIIGHNDLGNPGKKRTLLP